MRSLPLLFALLASAGCAPVSPAWSGGATTPRGRHDVALGGAVRVPLGEEANEPRREAAPAGIAPVAYYRAGLPERWDLGVAVLGPGGRVELRREHVLEDGSTRKALLYGLTLEGVWVPLVDAPPPLARGESLSEGSLHLGATLPVLYGLEIGGIFEAWLGARLRLAAVEARTTAEPTRATWNAIVAPEATVGVAAGFRRVHAFVELAAGYEWWSERGGLAVLTPGFGLRLRI